MIDFTQKIEELINSRPRIKTYHYKYNGGRFIVDNTTTRRLSVVHPEEHVPDRNVELTNGFKKGPGRPALYTEEERQAKTRADALAYYYRKQAERKANVSTNNQPSEELK